MEATDGEGVSPAIFYNGSTTTSTGLYPDLVTQHTCEIIHDPFKAAMKTSSEQCDILIYSE